MSRFVTTKAKCCLLYTSELKLENKQSSNIAVVVPSFHDNDRNYLIVSGEDFTLEFNKHKMCIRDSWN